MSILHIKFNVIQYLQNKKYITLYICIKIVLEVFNISRLSFSHLAITASPFSAVLELEIA